MRLVCLSDTHNLHDAIDVPDGDVLLHAGDFTGRGTESEIEAFASFLARLSHRHKIVVAGNHEFLFERERARAEEMLGDVTYLQDARADVEGLVVWGSPWQPWFGDWAFNLERGAPLAHKWSLVPDETDILVTHGPPQGILDRTQRGEPVGCEALGEAVARVTPGLHVFGHIHEGRGITKEGATLFVNASNCDLRYRPVHPPVAIDWSETGPVVVTG